MGCWPCGKGSASYGDLLQATESEDLAKVTKCLKRGVDPNEPGENKRLALHKACERNNIEIVRALINSRANVNLRNEVKRTPLHLAAKRGCVEVTRLLLDSGAKVEPGAKEDNHPLLSAAGEGHSEIVEMLLNHGANPNVVGKVEAGGKIAPLHKAAGKGHAHVVEMLIARGADVNKKLWHNYTPLHYAAHGGHKGVIQVLLDHGANAKSKEKDGKTAMEIAVAQKYDDCAALLGRMLLEAAMPKSFLSMPPISQPSNRSTGDAGPSTSALDRTLQQHRSWHSMTESVAQNLPPVKSTVGDLFTIVKWYPQSRGSKVSALLMEPPDDVEWFGKLYLDNAMYSTEKNFYLTWKSISSSLTYSSRVGMEESFPVLREWFNRGEGVGSWLIMEKGTQSLQGLISRWNFTRSMEIHERNRHLTTIFESLVRALSVLHSHNCVHRDLKPSVMMYFEDPGSWKLTDFSSVCSVGEVMPMWYSIRYAAPEVVSAHIRGSQGIAALTSMDMWSLGVVMLDVFSITKPLSKIDDKTWLQMLNQELQFPWEEEEGWLEEHMPPQVAANVKCLLRRSPDQRLTAQQLMSASMFRRSDAKDAPPPKDSTQTQIDAMKNSMQDSMASSVASQTVSGTPLDSDSPRGHSPTRREPALRNTSPLEIGTHHTTSSMPTPLPHVTLSVQPLQESMSAPLGVVASIQEGSSSSLLSAQDRLEANTSCSGTLVDHSSDGVLFQNASSSPLNAASLPSNLPSATTGGDRGILHAGRDASPPAVGSANASTPSVDVVFEAAVGAPSHILKER